LLAPPGGSTATTTRRRRSGWSPRLIRLLDLVIVASMQRIEHYEIAAYGTDIALAKALGEKELVKLLICRATASNCMVPSIRVLM
jgi:hypothetical protein